MKEIMSRRSFIGSSAALAGGAALGIAADRGCRQIGPVDLKFCLFGPTPVILPAFLDVDEGRNRFGMRLFQKYSEINEVVFPLADVKRAALDIRAGWRCHRNIMITNKDGSVISVPTQFGNDGGKFLIVTGQQSESFWFDLKDVRRVL